MSRAAGVMHGMASEVARVAAAVAAIAVAVTHPLAWRAANALPGDLGDPLLGAFILGWDASRMPRLFSGVWSAPFFYPLKDTLALSEHLLGVAIFTSPVTWLTGNSVLAHNVAFLGSYVLAGVGMYMLARALWGRKDAAFLAALAFAFAPHRIMHVSHLQVLMSGWMPVSLWGLHGYFLTGSRRALAVFAAAFALLGLSNGYFLYFFTVPTAIVAAVELVRLWKSGTGPWRTTPLWRALLDLGWAALAVAAAIAPAALAYARVRGAHGVHRSLGEMESFSATWPAYLNIGGGPWVWSGLLKTGDGERMLFPGATIAILAVVGALSIWRGAWAGRESRPPGWTRRVGTYIAILIAAVWFAAGPSTPGPYRLMLHLLPGFDGLRVPARFIVVVALALAALGSAGAAWLFARIRPHLATALAMGLGGLIVAEGWGAPIPLAAFRHDQPVRAPLNGWLRQGPPGGVLELPIVGPELEPFTLPYQYNTLLHGHPIVNGYSGYGYGLQDFLGGPGSPVNDPDALPGLLDGLRAIRVRYVVLHKLTYASRPDLGWPDPALLVEAIDRAAGRTGRQFNADVAWLLEPPRRRPPVDPSLLSPVPAGALTVTSSAMPDRLRFAFDGNIDTKWLSGAPQEGAEWLRLAFGADLDVGRIVILTNRLGVGDYPRALLVESETADGSRITLYSGSFLPALIEGLSTGDAGSPAALDLPSNRSRALWIRQTARTRTWQWAVHELQVFERRASR